ncbi:hypothetical protein V2I08_12980 [Sphingobium sp. MK2]
MATFSGTGLVACLIWSVGTHGLYVIPPNAIVGDRGDEKVKGIAVQQG